MRPYRFLPLLVLLLAALSPSVAWAQGAPSIDTMFSNFADSSVKLMNMVRWAGLPIGLYISGLALIRLKDYSESGGRTKLSTPLLLAAIGAMLIAFPMTANIATQTLALGDATGNSLSQVPSGGGAPGVAAALAGVLLFVKLVGHIAFFRGFLILKGVAEGQQGAGVGRALTHIFGGAAAININATIDILANTFAPGMGLQGIGL